MAPRSTAVSATRKERGTRGEVAAAVAIERSAASAVEARKSVVEKEAKKEEIEVQVGRLEVEVAATAVARVLFLLQLLLETEAEVEVEVVIAQQLSRAAVAGVGGRTAATVVTIGVEGSSEV